MNNDQMKAGRFLKLQKGKNLYSSIVNHIRKGGTVYICTQLKITKLLMKHESMIKLGKSGSVYVNKNCIDFCGVKFG